MSWNETMDLDELCKKLIEHGLMDSEKFKPNFTERIMREGGASVLQNQDADVSANIKLFKCRITSCIQAYSPEKVETYFFLQELANHARMCFYEMSGERLDTDDRKEKRKFTEQDRKRVKEMIGKLEKGFYKSEEIGESIGLSPLSVGVSLSHLSEEEREKFRIRYISAKREWEKY